MDPLRQAFAALGQGDAWLRARKIQMQRVPAEKRAEPWFKERAESMAELSRIFQRIERSLNAAPVPPLNQVNSQRIYVNGAKGETDYQAPGPDPIAELRAEILEHLQTVPNRTEYLRSNPGAFSLIYPNRDYKEFLSLTEKAA